MLLVIILCIVAFAVILGIGILQVAFFVDLPDLSSASSVAGWLVLVLLGIGLTVLPIRFIWKWASASAAIAPSTRRLGVEASQSTREYRSPKPGKLLHPDPASFEEYCAEWSRYLGYADAVKTQNSRDGGVDIRAKGMIAQVKYQASPVGVRPIRELNGVRRQGEEVLFFALNGYTPEARREASQMGLTLLVVKPLDGKIDILS